MKDNLPVILNIYRIKEKSFLSALGIKLFHTAIEYDQTEYAFGYLNEPEVSGIYDIKPMTYDDGTFIESITIGYLSRRQFFTKFEKIKKIFLAQSYNFLTKNCNHFTNDLIKLLFDKELPDKYRSFLKVGEFFRKIF